MRVIVTGGAGFIGSHVADRLLARGDEVTALDSFDDYYDPAQKHRNVARASSAPGYRLVEADICDGAALERAFDLAAPDAVVHLAARAGVRASVEQPLAYVTTNEVGGVNVLEACRRRGGVPIAFASTSSVYGAASEPPFREDEAADRPLSPYAASKRGSELMVHAYHHVHRQPAAILRFFTVYGPRGRPDMAFSGFTRALIEGAELRLHGEETARDFTFVDDIVDGVLGALDWAARTRGLGTFNLGRSEPVRVRRLIELLAAAFGLEARVRVVGLGASESPVTCARIDRAREAFGYEPLVSLESGVARWREWCEESDEAPAWLRPTGRARVSSP